MAKYKKEVSKETVEDAEQLAKSIQRPGQTKEQTKLIAQGIQKGIELYKKNHKVKARELDKKLKKMKINEPEAAVDSIDKKSTKLNTLRLFLPWAALLLSWFYFFTQLK